MDLTRNSKKSYSRISSFMVAKEDSDAKGDLVTIYNRSSNSSSSSSSRKKNNGEDGGGDDDDDDDNNNNNNNTTLLSANTRMPNVTITD